MLAAWKESYDKPRQHIKKQRRHFADKGPYNQNYGFSSTHVWMWELDHKEGWMPKNWCFQTVVLEKTLDSPLDSKEIKPVNPKVSSGQPWIFIGRTDAQVEAPILWPPDANRRVTGKDAGKEFPDVGKDWRQEKGMTEDDTVGWHHQLNGHEFEQTLWDSKDREAWHAAVHGVAKSWTQQRSNIMGQEYSRGSWITPSEDTLISGNPFGGMLSTNDDHCLDPLFPWTWQNVAILIPQRKFFFINCLNRKIDSTGKVR